MVTETREEALAVLEVSYPALIAKGREVAAELCRSDPAGETHARRVFEEMVARNIEGVSDVKGHWLGAVFNCAQFEWTGRWYTEPMGYTDAVRTTHAGRPPVRIWRLASTGNPAVQ